MSGLLYDSSAIGRISDVLDEQEKKLQEVDKEQDNKKIIRYAIVLGASVLIILGLRLLVNKKK
jgi:hypothetical protein